MQEDCLMHHGIAGQKWGVRRFQNEDGSLTELGKKRAVETGAKVISNNLLSRASTALNDKLDLDDDVFGDTFSGLSDSVAEVAGTTYSVINSNLISNCINRRMNFTLTKMNTTQAAIDEGKKFAKQRGLIAGLKSIRGN